MPISTAFPAMLHGILLAVGLATARL